eukprot:6691557-Alexandrium_andersonii.AAC.1
MSASLVGSEMCIRDRLATTSIQVQKLSAACRNLQQLAATYSSLQQRAACLLYTSDAADDM